jgi:Phospholipase_D-nuclease N-terminal
MRFLLYAVPVVVTLYALIDAILTEGSATRILPKWLWLVVIVLIPLLGAIAWLLGGRPVRVPVGAASGGGASSRRRGLPTAPDDDPAFLRKLADDEWRRKMRERQQGDGDTPSDGR